MATTLDYWLDSYAILTPLCNLLKVSSLWLRPRTDWSPLRASELMMFAIENYSFSVCMCMWDGEGLEIIIMTLAIFSVLRIILLLLI